MVKPCDPTALTTYYLALFVPSGTQGLNYSFPSSTVLCFMLGLAPGNSICAKFGAKSSSPSRGWTASPVLPVEVPVECLSCDAHCVPLQGVPNPPPFPLLGGIWNWSLLRSSPEFFIGNSVRPYLIRKICRRQVFTQKLGVSSLVL